MKKIEEIYKTIYKKLKVSSNVIIEDFKQKNIIPKETFEICSIPLSNQILEGYDESLKEDIVSFLERPSMKALNIGNYKVLSKVDDNTLIFYGKYSTLIKIKGHQSSNRYLFNIYGIDNRVRLGPNYKSIWKYLPKKT